MSANISPAVPSRQQLGYSFLTNSSISLAGMGSPTHTRTITAADRAAAGRLKARWLAMPRGVRPTQQALSDAWVGNSEANQSLISQYMNARIALNYHAVRFFAAQLKCAESDIRNDLPEQRLTDSAAGSPRSQPARPDFDKLADSIRLLRHFLEIADRPDADIADPVLLADAYEVVDAEDQGLTASNVIDLTKRLAAKIRTREVDDGTERGKVAGAGAADGRPHWRRAGAKT